MLPRKSERSGGHAAREFQEGNDGSGERDSTNENAEVGRNELDSPKISEQPTRKNANRIRT